MVGWDLELAGLIDDALRYEPNPLADAHADPNKVPQMAITHLRLG